MDYVCEQGLSLVIAMDEILKQSAKRREVAATVAISLGLQSLFRAKRGISYRSSQ